MSAVDLSEVGVQLGSVRALVAVSVTFEQGTRVGIVGPNGAGKTTLANVVCGYYHPSTGRVAIYGTDVTRAAPARIARLGVGRSLQSVGRVQGITALQFLSLGLETRWPVGLVHTVLGTPAGRRAERWARATATSLLQEMDLARYGPVPLEDCPYGVRKYVDVLRTLVGRARVVVLDEPTSGLSNDERSEMHDLLARWTSDTPTTLLLIDHDVGFVRGLCSRSVALDAGKLVAAGATDEVLADPRVIRSFTG
ncbi:MAG: ATP-binding cassette domain-containing protein [Actinomycetota bacterium]|jgi:branched-chain amino acid transport system ATP-binding protein|nr:ATP-binding cassette domain-containing protein [Actinomycetota bacterium]